jgi:hypothetical protein
LEGKRKKGIEGEERKRKGERSENLSRLCNCLVCYYFLFFRLHVKMRDKKNSRFEREHVVGPIFYFLLFYFFFSFP